MRSRVIGFLLWILSSSALAADSTTVSVLEREMYRLYATDSTDRFFEVTDRLKSLALQANDERRFYKVWSNQALFQTTHGNRRRGLEVIREVRDYAIEHESNFGLFTSTYVNATLLSSQHLEDQAEKMFLHALDYQHRYFPDESAAATYLGLAKIYVNQGKNDKVLECAEKALSEPNIIPQHQLTAWSYRCIALGTEALNDKEAFNKAYAEREKLKEKMGSNDSFGSYVDVQYADMNGNYQQMLELALGMRKNSDRLNLISRAYARLGDYENAYRYALKFKHYSDSLNTSELVLQSSESALQLDLMRAENETKDLRLANQSIELRMGMLIMALILIFLGFYIYRRRKQIQRLREAYDKLEETTIEKERIESELRITRDIQMGMVPSVFPAFPDRSDIDLHALMVPAREVGGDLYDFSIQGGKLYFCVGDVSGKGVPACMTMMVVINMFRTFVKEGFPPAYIVTRLNDMLSDGNENCTFVTMFVGQIDLESGSMDYCNAGHTPPVIIDVQHPQLMEMETNAPIGLWPGLEYVQEHIGNIKGKPLIVYTDGLTEAENARMEQFSERRMLEVLEWNRFENARQTIELLHREVKSHVSNAIASDDLTMMCIHIKPPRIVLRKKLTIKNKLEELRRVAVFVEEIGMELKLDGMMLNNLELVLEEAVSNVIFYAYDEGGQGARDKKRETETGITLVAESDGQELTFILSDQGQAFDPTMKPDVDTDVNPAERNIGGHGIFIVKNIMNEVTYQRLDGHNLLTMKKNL